MLLLAACGGGGSESGFVATSGEHTCAVHADGSLECWGDNVNSDVSGPNGASGMFTQVAVGDEFTCAVDVDSHLQCWGNFPSGANCPPLASTTTTTSTTSTTVTLPLPSCGSATFPTCLGTCPGTQVCTPNLSMNCVCQGA